jgi:predicted pyridoxine 5'-phosphate oxidase superfamily flavin-nucleotide-binding protein
MDAPRLYADGPRALQDHFDSRRLADRLEERVAVEALEDWQRKVITTATFFFLSTVDADGWPDVSYKGGAPGFVQVLDEHRIAFPSYDGNGMYRSMGNIVDTGKVALLFVDFDRPKRLRLHGTATVHRDGPLLERFVGAELAVEVRVGRAFMNCPRYLHNLRDGQLSEFAPREGHVPPEPEWKAMPVWREVLPGTAH